MTHFRCAMSAAILVLSACGSDSPSSSSLQDSVPTAESTFTLGGAAIELTSVKPYGSAGFVSSATSSSRQTSANVTNIEERKFSQTNSRRCAAFVERTSTPYKLCDKGSGIRQLQQILYENGLLVPEDNNPVDGYFGSATENAVKAYQSRSGLPATGIVDATLNRKILDDFKGGRGSANSTTTVPISQRSDRNSQNKGSCLYLKYWAPVWAPNGSQVTFGDFTLGDVVKECRNGTWVLVAQAPRQTKTVVSQICSTQPTGMSSSWHGVMYSYSIYDVWSDGSKTRRSGGMAYGDQLPEICW